MSNMRLTAIPAASLVGHLYSRAGNDTPQGRDTADYLESDSGTDTDKFESSLGKDTLNEQEGMCAIQMDGKAVCQGKSRAGRNKKPLFYMHRYFRKASLLACIGAAALVSGCSVPTGAAQDLQVVEMAKAGKAYFEDKCKTVAGEKIYRTVPDVEGVLLMKVRPQRSQTELEDPMWPGAAFAIEAYGDDYIKTFIGYEYGTGNNDGSKNSITKDHRGYIAPDKRPGGRPGYRYVDVIDANDGQRVRVTHKSDEPWQYDKSYLKGYTRYFLDKTPTTAPAPRYGVTYEDHVIPAERAMGVASSTVKVIDLQTNEVLGEMVRYAFRPRGIRLTQWEHGNKCPAHYVGSDEATRKFVDQVLIPKGE